MRWLLHGNLSPAAAEALKRHGHTIADPPLDPAAGPIEVLEAARLAQADLITNDPALAHTAIGPSTNKRFARSLVFLHVAGGDIEQDDAIDRLFKRYKRLSPSRLYTVTENRVKIRQLPEG